MHLNRMNNTVAEGWVEVADWILNDSRLTCISQASPSQLATNAADKRYVELTECSLKGVEPSVSAGYCARYAKAI